MVLPAGVRSISASESLEQQGNILIDNSHKLERGGENYTEWSTRMRLRLRSLALDDLIDNPSPPLSDPRKFDLVAVEDNAIRLKELALERESTGNPPLASQEIPKRQRPLSKAITEFEQDLKRRRQLYDLLNENIDSVLFEFTCAFIRFRRGCDYEDPVKVWQHLEAKFCENPNATQAADRQMQEITSKADFTLNNVLGRLDRYEQSYWIFSEGTSADIVRLSEMSRTCAFLFIRIMMRTKDELSQYGYGETSWGEDDMETLPKRLRRFVRRMKDIRTERLALEDGQRVAEGNAGADDVEVEAVVEKKKGKKKGKKRGRGRGGAR